MLLAPEITVQSRAVGKIEQGAEVIFLSLIEFGCGIFPLICLFKQASLDNFIYILAGQLDAGFEAILDFREVRRLLFPHFA